MLTGFKNKNIAIVGCRESAELSKRLHGMLADCNCVVRDVKSGDELKKLLDDSFFNGFEIEGEMQKTAAPLVDKLSPEAQRLGRVSVAVRDENGLSGYNTECGSFLFLLKENSVDPRGKKVIVLTDGEEPTAILDALSEAGAAETAVISGDESRDSLEFHDDAQILVNMTACGMFPAVDEKPVEPGCLAALEEVVDLVCFPPRTELMLDAEEIGIKAVGGMDARAFGTKEACKLFCKASVTDTAAYRAAASLESEMKNIVLVGMPGCGKSTIAAELAKLSDRQVIDTDKAVEAMVGLDIPEIFELYGEEYFRKCESEIIKSAAVSTGGVIATGAGAILRSENIKELRRNSVVVFLLRDDETESTAASREKKLSKERIPLYLAASDVVVKLRETPRETVKALMKAVCQK